MLKLCECTWYWINNGVRVENSKIHKLLDTVKISQNKIKKKLLSADIKVGKDLIISKGNSFRRFIQRNDIIREK